MICPSFTCMATANAIHHSGASPAFAEIEARTYNLDPARIEEAITPRTRAILLVHQIGLPADVDSVAAVASRDGLALIEDGACTFGGAHKGKRIGGIAGPTCFSFHPRRMIAAGEGGMIATNDGDLAEKARVLRSTGASVSDLVRHRAEGTIVQEYGDVGYNCRMTGAKAAIGLIQFETVDAMLEQRSSLARRYDAALAEIEDLEPHYVPAYATHAYSSYAARLRPGSPVDRDTLVRRMADAGISCRVGIQPLHWEPIYRERWGALGLPVTEAAARTVFFLPIFPGMTGEQKSRVVENPAKRSS